MRSCSSRLGSTEEKRACMFSLVSALSMNLRGAAAGVRRGGRGRPPRCAAPVGETETVPGRRRDVGHEDGIGVAVGVQSVQGAAVDAADHFSGAVLAHPRRKPSVLAPGAVCRKGQARSERKGPHAGRVGRGCAGVQVDESPRFHSGAKDLQPLAVVLALRDAGQEKEGRQKGRQER